MVAVDFMHEVRLQLSALVMQKPAVARRSYRADVVLAMWPLEWGDLCWDNSSYARLPVFCYHAFGQEAAQKAEQKREDGATVLKSETSTTILMSHRFTHREDQ